MSNKELSLKDKLLLIRERIIITIKIIYLNDKEFKCVIKAMKFIIWLSLIWLILNITITIIGCY